MSSWVCLVALVAASAAGAMAEPSATLLVSAEETTIGDRFPATLTVDLPSGSSFDPPELGPALGKFSVFSGAWEGPLEHEGARRWRWAGTLAAFETGEIEIPGIPLVANGPDGPLDLRTAPVTVQVTSVLDAADSSSAESEIADIKPPVSLDPEYGALATGLAIFGALLGASLILWWLHRRYAARLVAVPAPDDPFQRQPPHEWVYRELQRLLERRIAEQGHVDEFYSELSRIVKRYLEGRYRVDLLERTTAEVAARLEQGGAPPDALESSLSLLGRCDQVKFARDRPRPEAWRAAIETVYEIVDRTKPAEVRDARTGRGAA